MIHPPFVVDTVKQILTDYDFVLVAERIEESLAALALIMDIDIPDLIISGEHHLYYYNYLNNRRSPNEACCIPLIPAPKPLSPGVQNYFGIGRVEGQKLWRLFASCSGYKESGIYNRSGDWPIRL